MTEFNEGDVVWVQGIVSKAGWVDIDIDGGKEVVALVDLKNVGNARKTIKPVVPQVVVEYYEHYKNRLSCFEEWFANDWKSDFEEVGGWLYDVDYETQKQRELALATLIVNGVDAVEVEKEKCYRIKMKWMSRYSEYLNYDKEADKWYLSTKKTTDKVSTSFTKHELEQAGFGWMFDCEDGIEIEEVE